jgi:hypothetical protein
MKLRPGAIWTLLVLCGCGSGQDVSTRTLSAAKRLWAEKELRNYNLEWTSRGARQEHYAVYVREGEVRSVRSVDPAGAEFELHPADPSYFGINGLFRVIEEELAQALDDRPFGMPKGTRLLQKWIPDPDYGFPRQYRRDVMGAIKGLAIDVILFQPVAAGDAPPPPRAGSKS